MERKDLNGQIEEYYTGLDSRIKFNNLKEDSDNEVQKQKYSLNPRRIDYISGKIRRYHEEYHAMTQSTQVEKIWMEIINFFNKDKKLIEKIYYFINFSLGSVFHFFYERLDESRNVKLIYQHRMPKIIADFLNKNVYFGDLKSKTPERAIIPLPNFKELIPLGNFPKYLLWFSTEYLSNNEENYLKPSFNNNAEAEVILNIIKKILELDVEKFGFNDKNLFRIGVINYYAKQAKLIRQKLQTIPKDIIKGDGRWAFKAVNKPIRIRVSIVDRFQGQEQEIIILSLTRNNKKGKLGFLKNMQRVNVSLSRAKNYLYLIGDFSFFNQIKQKDLSLLIKLAKYCQENHRVINLYDDCLENKIDERANLLFKNFVDNYEKIKQKSIKNINKFHYKNPKKYHKVFFFKNQDFDKNLLEFKYFKLFLRTLLNTGFKLYSGRRTHPNEVLFEKIIDKIRYGIYVVFYYTIIGRNRKEIYYFNLELSAIPLRSYLTKIVKIKCPFCQRVIKSLNNFGNHFKNNWLRRGV